MILDQLCRCAKSPWMNHYFQKVLKYGTANTLTADIAHNPLLFGGGFSLELQTQIHLKKKKTTNMADVSETGS